LQKKFGLPYGFLFQGQSYEGLVCVVLEFLWGNGGKVFDDDGRLVLDSPRNREALTLLVDLIYRERVSPLAVTTFLEEDCRYAFQAGYAAAMRNWPYAYALMEEPDSQVKGKFAVLPPLHGPEGWQFSAGEPWQLMLFRATPTRPQNSCAFSCSLKISGTGPWPWACCRP